MMAKTKRTKIERSLKSVSIENKSTQKREVEIYEAKKVKNRSFNENVLIVCEGETEAAYFYGLNEITTISDHYNLDILPQKDQNENHKGSSIKGLLYEAMKKQIDEKLKYQDIWIITDNDEENAYKLDDQSLEKIEKQVPNEVYIKLYDNQRLKINVRDNEIEKNEHLRIRYFLNLNEYKLFLKELEIEETHWIAIINSTTKKKELDKLFNNKRKELFYENGDFITTYSKGQIAFDEKYFNEKILNSIKVAYTCISFEYWLLLHFENNQTPFYNSREIVKYFDDKNYFNCVFKQEIGYEKGWHLYRLFKENQPIVKSFFNKYDEAIFNNFKLINFWNTNLVVGQNFFEVNPFSDIYILTHYLIKQENIIFLKKEESFSFNRYKNIKISISVSSVSINFEYSASFLWKQHKNSFSAISFDNEQLEISSEKPIFDRGENISIQISNTGKPFFLSIKTVEKQMNVIRIWQIEP